MITLKAIVEIFAVIQKIKASWEAIRDRPLDEVSESIVSIFNGEPVVRLTSDVEQSLGTLFELVATNDIEDQAKPIVMAIDRFAASCQDWVNRFSRESVATIEPDGSPRMWADFAAIENAIKSATKRRSPPAIPPAKVKGVPIDHMCETYGFLTSDGKPDRDKLREELETPGKHYDPEKWVSPLMQRVISRVNKEFEGRIPPKNPFTDVMPVESKVKPKRVYTEDEVIAMLENNYPIDQVVNITGWNRSSLLEMINLLEIDRSEANSSLPASPEIAQQKLVEAEEKARKQQAELAAIDSHPEIESIEDRVIACHLDGVKPSQIAAAIGNGLTLQKVVSIIRKAA